MQIFLTQKEYDLLMQDCLTVRCSRCPFHSGDGMVTGVCAAEWLKEQDLYIIEEEQEKE